MSLISEIQAKADPADIAARRDKAVLAAVNAGRTKVASVTRNQFAIWCGQTGMRAKIEDHADNKASPLRSIALLCRDMLQGGPDVLELSNPANVAMLQAWVSAGECAQADADALVALATVPDLYTLDQVSAALSGSN